MLTDKTIKDILQDNAYERGLKYFRAGKVANLREKRFAKHCYTAVVSGSGGFSYQVDVDLDDKEKQIGDCYCDCPAFASYQGACKHVAAVLLAIRDLQAEKGETGTAVHDQRGRKLISLFAEIAEQPAKEAAVPLRLVPTLHYSQEYYQRTLWLEFSLGQEKMYVLRNIRDFYLQSLVGGTVVFGKGLTVDTGRLGFKDDISARLWELIRKTAADDISLHQDNYYFRSNYDDRSSFFAGKKFLLTERLLQEFAAIMGETPFEFVYEDRPEKMPLKFEPGNPPVSLAVEEKDGQGVLRFTAERAVRITDKGNYFWYANEIYLADEQFAKVYDALENSFGLEESVSLPMGEMGDFFAHVLPQLEQVAEVEVAEGYYDRFTMVPLQASIYLDYYKDGIEARLEYAYENIVFNPFGQQPETKLQDGRILVRDYARELKIKGSFEKCKFSRLSDDVLVQPEEELAYEFLQEELPKLSSLADVFYAEAFKRSPVQKINAVSMGVHITDDNLLQLELKGQNFDFAELVELLGSYRQKRKYHRLKDGTFVSLEEQQLAALADFFTDAGITKAEGDGVTLPLADALYLEGLDRDNAGFQLSRSKDFRRLVRDILQPQELDWELPPSLAGVLRDYQVTGFNWLSSLAAHGLGGILADDMGLGKTLQVIAFLLAHRQQGRTALVVAPTSLVYNWLEEIARFAPELRAAAVAGTKPERKKILARAAEYDVLVTTYGLLKRDSSLYEEMTFSYCFLDEAQHIKNPATQNARAAKRLKTGGYFALTGTPIENTLTELWSIFDFLLPGYLSTHKKFMQRYEVPIIREKDKAAFKDLHRHVAPFILRRLKKDVLQELPDKSERRMVNVMTAEQEKVYWSYFVQGKKEFASALKAHGFQGSRLKILAILTRLRQIACEPSLFLENYQGGSGKLEMLEEVVSEAVEAGHRILIFSQFTQMLAKIAAVLQRLKIEYFYLDGSTPAAERMRLVRAFNSGSRQVFLISLKAGGTGLNLTGADMVIHYDPWWNPAVEDQATDRAYRLGQKNNVQVLKFITKNTIEEQIYELQNKKKALIDQMIQPGENFLSKLTDEEIMGLFQA